MKVKYIGNEDAHFYEVATLTEKMGVTSIKEAFSEDQLRLLELVLSIPCCHVTGMHDPTHFKEGKERICEIQRSEAYKRAIRALRITPEVFSRAKCGWCSRNSHPEIDTEFELDIGE